MAPLKEPYFFTTREMRHHRFPKATDAYLGLFAQAGNVRWLGEASTAYFWDEESPGKIQSVSPDARIVISLRDPVARAYSGYWHAVRFAGETRSFVDVVREESASINHVTRDEVPGYVAAGLYVAGLERYLSRFFDHVLVIFFEDLVADPRTEIRRIFRFLDIDSGIADSLQLTQRNASASPRNVIFKRLLAEGQIRALARKIVPSRLQPSLSSIAWDSNISDMDPEARKLLLDVYAGQRPRLEALLGRSLPW